MEIFLSKIDQERFGYVIAKSKLCDTDKVEELLSQARTLGVELLIVRLATDNLKAAQELERNNAILTDTLIYYQKKNVSKYNIKLPEGYSACYADEGDAEHVGGVAAGSFKGYFGHYHSDNRLERIDCDNVYTSWAKNSCLDRKIADEVILIKKNNEIAAFSTLKIIEKNCFDGVLFGVSPAHTGQGLHLNLMQLSQNWGAENNISRMVTSTQINNVKVQKNWCRVGLEPLNSFYTFHVWLNHDSI